MKSLDVGAVQRVWPNVDATGLRNGFANAVSLQIAVTGCKVDVQAATAVCRRQQQWKVKAGNPKPTDQQVRFRLRKASDGWLIDGIDAL